MLHVSGYALLDQPSAGAVERACEMARGAGASLSIDLACADIVSPLVRERILQLQPDVALATAAQAEAIGGIDDLADLPVISDDGALPGDRSDGRGRRIRGRVPVGAGGRAPTRTTRWTTAVCWPTTARASTGRFHDPRLHRTAAAGAGGRARSDPIAAGGGAGDVAGGARPAAPRRAGGRAALRGPRPRGRRDAGHDRGRGRGGAGRPRRGGAGASLGDPHGAQGGAARPGCEPWCPAAWAPPRWPGRWRSAASRASTSWPPAALGGVHRGWQQTRDVSADTYEIAFAAVCVVCSGVKSLLDVSATLEELGDARDPGDRIRHRPLPAVLPARQPPPPDRPRRRPGHGGSAGRHALGLRPRGRGGRGQPGGRGGRAVGRRDRAGGRPGAGRGGGRRHSRRRRLRRSCWAACTG